MARNHAMGHDPLDWVGKRGTRDGSSSGYSDPVRTDDSREDGESTAIESFPTAEIVDSFPERTALTTEQPFVADNRTSLALERELLLLDEYDSLGRLRHRPRSEVA